MATDNEQSLGVWSYPHYVKYLCAIVNKLSRNRPKHVQRIIEQAMTCVVNDVPRTMAEYRCTPTVRRTRRQAVQQVANCICEIVTCWTDQESRIIQRTAAQEILDPSPSESHLERSWRLYERARDEALGAENIAFEYGLTHADLHDCALSAFEEFAQLDDKRKDAALCVMEIGHYGHAVRIIKKKI